MPLSSGESARTVLPGWELHGLGSVMMNDRWFISKLGWCVTVGVPTGGSVPLYLLPLSFFAVWVLGLRGMEGVVW